MSENQTDAVAGAQWAAERALVAERLSACVHASGQSGRPHLSFNAAKIRDAKTSERVGHPVSKVLAYDSFTDTVTVDLPMLLGAPSVCNLSDPELVAMVDGFLLHELGHRRDRFTEFVVHYGGIGAALVWIPCWALSEVLDQMMVNVIGVVAACALAGVWKLASVPVGRRQERRADEYMADVGGATVSAAMLAGVARGHVPGGDPWKVYDDPAVRRTRVERRLAQRR